METLIRRATPEDSVDINRLSKQLGYFLTEEQTLNNIIAVLNNNDHDVFAALYQNQVIGWIGVVNSVQIETLSFCVINELIVDEMYRGKGIGKSLIEKAKQWAKEKGSCKIRLRCNVKRTGAHLFYQHLGFKEIKEQKVFEINI